MTTAATRPKTFVGKATVNGEIKYFKTAAKSIELAKEPFEAFHECTSIEVHECPFDLWSWESKALFNLITKKQASR